MPIWQWLTLAVFVLPPAVDLARGGARRAVGYLAADAFYYLTVARNLAEHGQATFDSVRPVNGFHPLWQGILGVIYAGAHALGVDDLGMLSLTTWLCLGLVALALWLLMRTMNAAEAGSGVTLLLLPVGVYGLLVSPLWWSLDADQWRAQNNIEGPQPLYGTLWSFVNGMESGVLLAAYAGALWVWVSGRPLARTRDAVALGLLLGAVALSRLDHAVISVSFCALVLLAALRHGERPALARAGAVVALTCACLGAFVLWSLASCDTALPVSGSFKSTFPDLHNENFHRLRSVLDRLPDGRRHLGTEYRVAQLIVPTLAALAALPLLLRVRLADDGITLAFRRQETRRLDAALLATALSNWVMAGYVWFFVRGGHQGHWYFPVSIVFVTLLVMRTLSGPRLATILGRPWLAAPIAVVALAVSLVYFRDLHAPSGYHANYRTFIFEVAPHVRRALGPERPKLLGLDDGIVAYATGFPTMNGTGLMLDAKGVRAKRAGSLMTLANRRGYPYVASLSYVPLGRRLGARPNATHIKRSLGGWLGKKDARQLDFELTYRDPKTGFGIVRSRIRPKRPGKP